MRVYEFVEREKANHPVRRICRVLGVAPSGYWAWRQRGLAARAQADAPLTEPMRAIHQRGARVGARPTGRHAFMRHWPPRGCAVDASASRA